MKPNNVLHIINSLFNVSYKKFLKIAKAKGYRYKTSGLDPACIPNILKKKSSYVTVVSNGELSFHKKVLIGVKGVYFKLPLYKVLIYSEKSFLDKRKQILSYVRNLLCNCIEQVPDSVEIVGYNLLKNTAEVIDHSKNDGLITINLIKRNWHRTWKSFYEVHLPSNRRSVLKKEKLRVRRFDVLHKKLSQLGTNNVTINCNDYDEKPGLVKLWYKSTKAFFVKKNFFVEITLGDLTNVKQKRNQLLRHIIAYFRYNRSLVPVHITDKDYIDTILKYTQGCFIPSDGIYHSAVHGDKVKNRIKCVKCGAVRDIPKSKIFPKYCNVCNPKKSKNYSRQCISWLNDIQQRFGLSIRHAENGGEVRINLNDHAYHYVDGYSVAGNIIFEYHGSRWHGNPLVFYMDDVCNPYSKENTAYDLLLKTIRLERKLVNLGYTYIRIWDCDYLDKRRYQQWLVKNTKKIQQAIKQS